MPTVLDIWNRGLDYADMTDSTFPDTDHTLDYVNSAISDLHYMLADASPDAEWHYSTATINVVASTGTYSLPTDFYKLLGIWRIDGTRRFPVHKFMRKETGGYSTSPSQSATLSLEYVPRYTLLTSTNDNIDSIYPPGWDDIAAMAVAARLLHREESFEAEKSILSLRGEKLMQLMRGCTPRDIGSPEHVEDVSGRWRGADYRWQVNPAFEYRIAGSSLLLVEPAPNEAYYYY